jgi:hypothetical protein
MIGNMRHDSPLRQPVKLLPHLFLLLSFSLSFLVFHSYSLLITTCFGLWLISRFQLKGCLYAWALIIAESIGSHLFWDQAHLWRLGLEFSVASSLLIYALDQEESAQKEKLAQELKVAKEKVIANLEEDLSKLQEESLEEKLQSQSTIDALQKSFDELTLEKSSLDILNDVLRKNHAKLASEQEAWKEKIHVIERTLVQKTEESQSLEKEIAHLKNTDALLMDHKSLQAELNQTRIQKEQMKLINEALVRMHAKTVSQQHENQHLIEQLKKQPGPPANSEELHQLQCLYKQLKSQFEERNEVLHQTRANLFKADTELQTLRLKNELDTQDEPFKEIVQELSSLEKEVSALKEENQELEETITYLIHRSPFSAKQPPLMKSLREALSPKKKKIKAEQQQLPFP